MKQISALFATVVLVSSIAAQKLPASGGQTNLSDRKQWQDPRVSSVGRAPLRNEFISYDIREVAQRRDPHAANHYLPLNMFSTTQNGIKQLRTRVEIPYLWLDRDIFLHVEGIPTMFLTINDNVVGYSTDGRTPVEFNISKSVTNGLNTIAFEMMDGGNGAEMEDAFPVDDNPVVYIYSQPKLRVENYRITSPDDSTGRHSVFTVECNVSNSYNSSEKMIVGYDIYSPQGKLLMFDSREVTVPGNGRDTVTFEHVMYGSEKLKWTTANPSLYNVMLFVKRDGRLVEYIPLKAALSTTELRDGAIYRNGKPLKIKAARYNAAATEKQTSVEIKALKARGINTICVNYPQKIWFYELCDEIGMNVIDQANINSSKDSYNRNIGGSLSNNPAWKDQFVERVQSMYSRSRDHVSIIGWSLGGEVGNGYNMYKSYQWLKGIEPDRAVIFSDNQGEWNSDIEMPELMDAKSLLGKPVAKPQPRKR